jgi:hypothetical protein
LNLPTLADEEDHVNAVAWSVAATHVDSIGE